MGKKCIECTLDTYLVIPISENFTTDGYLIDSVTKLDRLVCLLGAMATRLRVAIAAIAHEYIGLTVIPR
ncbi:MAG: hypothetical protein AB4038_11115 [Prochloraceae cyanobacterium]